MAQVGGIVMLNPEVGGSKENFFFAGVDKVGNSVGTREQPHLMK